MDGMQLGKITEAKFGFGGYQGVQIVFQFRIETKHYSVYKIYECGWGHVSEEELKSPTSTYKWTHDGRLNQIGDKAWQVVKLMKDAKVESLDQLVGKPVRVIGQNDFEILQEVL